MPAVVGSGKAGDRQALAGLRDSKPLRYAIMRCAHPGKSKRWAARAAGYSPKSPTATIESIHAVQAATQSVAQYREHLQQCPDASLGAMVAQLIGVVQATEKRTDPDTGKVSTEYVASPKDRVAAIRQASAMLGYDAPTQVQAEVRGLLVEFAGLTSDDLIAVRAAMGAT